MQKKWLVGSVFAAIAISACYTVSYAQFGGGGRSPEVGGGCLQMALEDEDVEQVVRSLYSRLKLEKEEENPDSRLVAKHAELLNVLTKYVAADRTGSIIADLELMIKEMPGTPEAKRAAAAIDALKDVPHPRTSTFHPDAVIFDPID